LVTGASSGIGRGLAVRLAREGYAVGLLARRLEALQEVEGEILSVGMTATVLPCDVSDRERVHAAVRACEERLGPVDLLVTNAGQSEMTRVEDLDGSEVERLLKVNFLGAVYAVEAVLPGMRSRGSGQLVAVSSLTGFGGLPKTAAYSASKAAMNNFFESLRIDLRGSGVRVTVVKPGYVRTPLTGRNLHAMPFLVELDDAVDRIFRAIRSGRREVRFPWPLATLVWLGQIFPRKLYDWLAAKKKREKRQ
jgi:short-subunit dehydrogenase